MVVPHATFVFFRQIFFFSDPSENLVGIWRGKYKLCELNLYFWEKLLSNCHFEIFLSFNIFPYFNIFGNFIYFLPRTRQSPPPVAHLAVVPQPRRRLSARHRRPAERLARRLSPTLLLLCPFANAPFADAQHFEKKIKMKI